MTEDGRAYALAIAVQHLLRALERKGLMSKSETTDMLDAVCNELKMHRLEPDAGANAAMTIGALYPPTR